MPIIQFGKATCQNQKPTQAENIKSQVDLTSTTPQAMYMLYNNWQLSMSTLNKHIIDYNVIQCLECFP